MIAIIADIHGNYAALNSVLSRIESMGVTETVCLGDICGYYCQINECIGELRERGIFSLMGNHDQYISSESSCPRSDSANRCIDYQKSVITGDHLRWISELKPQAIRHGIDMVHGGWNDPLEEYVSPTDSYFLPLSGCYFASGHTHVPCIWHDSSKTKTYCNPGSVGQPRDGNPRASFATWDGTSFALHREEYDIKWVQYEMEKAGFDEYFYANLDKGSRIGGRIDRVQPAL
jgi:predicted phosphodiesterase